MAPIVQSPYQTSPTLHFSSQVTSDRKAATVFIIDQDLAVRDALSVSLRASGFDVLAYGSAGDFLGMMPASRRGCLLIEFDLVDMTGVELVARLAAQRIEVPAIIMSARLRMPLLGQSCPAGISAILQKPFGQDEMLKCLDRVLGRPSGIWKTT
ncbi:MAG: response regulator transcription factor [Geminicoccaceae bacterium]